MAPEKPHDFIFKVCLVGDPEVGKSSLVRRFVLDQFDETYMLTIGAKVMKKTVTVQYEGKDVSVSLLIWDLMGQKNFSIIESVALYNIVGGMVVCDLTRKSTYKSLEYWVEAVRKISPGIPMIVLGNKSDLLGQAQVTGEELGKASDYLTSTWFLTSAKTGENVEGAFKRLAEYCLRGVSNE
ncbi:MAG: GTP-binding protein [Candidatus Thermoplasmatota archaeon]|nr:GTP-binding protein [Candidatus Thermoplasmatota archaeon]MBU4591538.1 GTP-binding protein [Candidatus Thermoplasmatota archaeon]